MKKFYLYIISAVIPIISIYLLETVFSYKFVKSYGLVVYFIFFIVIAIVRGKQKTIARGLWLGFLISLFLYWFSYHYLLRGVRGKLQAIETESSIQQ